MITLGNIQIDSRRYVTEMHTMPSGEVKTIEYLASVDTDYQAVYNARVFEEPAPEPTVVEKAVALLSQVTPLAIDDPYAVKVAVNMAFTPEQFNGVMTAEEK